MIYITHKFTVRISSLIIPFNIFYYLFFWTEFINPFENTLYRVEQLPDFIHDVIHKRQDLLYVKIVSYAKLCTYSLWHSHQK